MRLTVGSRHKIGINAPPTLRSTRIAKEDEMTPTAGAQAPAVTAQNQWTWANGSNAQPGSGLFAINGTYGAMGTPAPGNSPSGREGAGIWKDVNGNLWLFGGYGNDDTGYTTDPLNDLWKYNPATNEWTWIGGSSTFASGGTGIGGSYGTLGTPASSNWPGSRAYSVTWVDANGNFWLFGGQGSDANSVFGALNDLWEYSPTSGDWTWVSGGNALPPFDYQPVSPQQANEKIPAGVYGVYGTLGTPAAGNVPTARWNSVGWTDKSGNLWLFGGYVQGTVYPSESSCVANDLNDLWMFNPTTKEWAWMGGSQPVEPATPSACVTAISLNQAPGVYNSQGTPSAANVPGAREQSVAWTDNNGNFWLFGGIGYASNDVYGWLNDLWEFVPSINQWAWWGGSSTLPGTPASAHGVGYSGAVASGGVYGTLGQAEAANIPGPRDMASAAVDTSGNFWLFGGRGYDANENNAALNDLWTYNVKTNEWTWVSGSSTGNNGIGQQPVYGTLDAPAESNVPGGRYGASMWMSADSNIFLFGGYGNNSQGTGYYLNDLWVFQTLPLTSQTTATPTVTVTPTPASITSAQSDSVLVTVSGGNSNPTPTGSVVLSGGTYNSGSQTLTSGSVNLVIPAGSLATSMDTLTATYTPDAASASTYGSATGSNTVTVTAAAPAVSLSATGPLTFTAVVGATSAAQTITLTNTGNAALSISGISISGANPSDFAQTNTCGSSLAAGASCTVSITFTPASAASFTASVSIADNATGSPQTVTLNGTGNPAPSFTVSSSTPSQTIAPGGTATYSISVMPQNGAFSNAVTLAASGLPTGATATFMPSSVTPGSAAASSTLTIQTAATTTTASNLSWPLAAPALAALGLFFLPGKRRRRWITLCLLLFASLGALTALTGCGDGFAIPAPANVSYNITITATSGSESQTTTVALTVQ